MSNPEVPEVPVVVSHPCVFCGNATVAEKGGTTMINKVALKEMRSAIVEWRKKLAEESMNCSNCYSRGTFCDKHKRWSTSLLEMSTFLGYAAEKDEVTSGYCPFQQDEVSCGKWCALFADGCSLSRRKT